MKEKIKKEIAIAGTKNIEYTKLSAVEAISMSVVAILALTLGTIFGDKLF